MTPIQRHQGEDERILQQRHQVYQTARAKHPSRWSGNTRNWEPVTDVSLNPDKATKQQQKKGIRIL